jgi:hypothetical protein
VGRRKIGQVQRFNGCVDERAINFDNNRDRSGQQF